MKHIDIMNIEDLVDSFGARYMGEFDYSNKGEGYLFWDFFDDIIGFHRYDNY